MSQWIQEKNDLKDLLDLSSQTPPAKEDENTQKEEETLNLGQMECLEDTEYEVMDCKKENKKQESRLESKNDENALFGSEKHVSSKKSSKGKPDETKVNR